ncbi:unnamed protein product [Aureobasidium vineae]|uniref:Uncharacterized protein n=1 Tax=Aureobasidium vineae TaxID=2773715 RepID=A0A9N8JFT4_9PEZI|nr:unnamed protein product [Aureobasidium vineae]
MPNDNGFCHKMLIFLGLMAVGVSLIIVSFGVALSNENNKILLDATMVEPGTQQRAFRAASCHVGTCTKEKTFWKTVIMPASTVTETATVHLPDYVEPTDHVGPARPTIGLSGTRSTTLMPHVMPTEDVEDVEQRKERFIRGGSRGRRIVDVNKPEMQM